MIGQTRAEPAGKSAFPDARPERYRFLDGLRGWAAAVVLLHHLFVDGLPANSLMADRALWAKVFFLNGMLAVSIFFVISGFSLSIRYLEAGDGKALGRVAAGRYLRLALPIFGDLRADVWIAGIGLYPAGRRAFSTARSIPHLHADRRGTLRLLVGQGVRRLRGRRELRCRRSGP